ncbi:MAG: peptidylprolyl isomerase [Rhodospirillales bacterium]
MAIVSKAGDCGRVAASMAATVLLFLLLCAADGSPVLAQAKGELPDDTFAVIDGETVLRSEFEAYFARYARSKLYHGGSAARLAKLRADATEQFVQDRLLLREAVRRGIEGDPEDVDKRIEKLEARYEGSENWAEVRKKLPHVRQALLDGTKIAALLAEVDRVADPDETELRRFYDENIELFTTPRQNRLALILLGVPPWGAAAEWQAANAKAAELFTRLEQGADFAALARAHSTDETAKNGGDLGQVHDGELSGPVQDAVDKIEPGDVTPPIRVLEGFVIFKLVDRSPPDLSPLEHVRKRALALYKRRLSKEQRERFLAALRERAVVTVGEPENATAGARDGTAR